MGKTTVVTLKMGDLVHRIHNGLIVETVKVTSVNERYCILQKVMQPNVGTIFSSYQRCYVKVYNNKVNLMSCYDTDDRVIGEEYDARYRRMLEFRKKISDHVEKLLSVELSQESMLYVEKSMDEITGRI